VSDVLGVILAGGRGERLGRPKPTAPLGRSTLLEHPLAALEGAGLETVVVAKAETPLPPVAAPVWTEPADPVHPLLGIVTALERSEGRSLLVCACDLPFVTAELVAWLAALDAPLAAPRTGGRLHPLFGRYTDSLAAPLREALERRAPLQETLIELGVQVLEEDELRAFGDPELLLFNVNTPEDLERAEALL
jgi:molybdopterin-guanine dinucleotide biosynthesis protein A